MNGPQLRDLLTPWLAGASFDKDTRELALTIRTVPLALLEGVPAAPLHRRAHREHTRTVAVRVGPPWLAGGDGMNRQRWTRLAEGLLVLGALLLAWLVWSGRIPLP